MQKNVSLSTTENCFNQLAFDGKLAMLLYLLC